MKRSIRGVIAAAVVVAIAGLAMFASTAFGFSGSSTNSCYSRAGGIGHAASTPAGYYAYGAPVSYYGQYYYPCYYYN